MLSVEEVSLLRYLSGNTNRALAKKLGVSPQAVASNGKSWNISKKTAPKVLAFLQESAEELKQRLELAHALSERIKAEEMRAASKVKKIEIDSNVVAPEALEAINQQLAVKGLHFAFFSASE